MASGARPSGRRERERSGAAAIDPVSDAIAIGRHTGYGCRRPTIRPRWFRYLDAVPLIAIDFPVFNDGRGYSTAAVLRSRYQYRGDLRAIGDVLIDQLFFLRRVGFTSFLLRADQDHLKAVAKLRTFSDAYQGAADDPLPAFRRHARPNARELAEHDK